MKFVRRVIFALCFLMPGALNASAATSFAVSDLPATSSAEADAMLEKLEAAYQKMDVDRFVGLFTDDFEQIDINRRVRVQGRKKWRDWTVLINNLHESMRRRHLGRITQGDLVIVETEWSGRLKPRAAGWNEEPLDYCYRGLIVMTVRDGKIARQMVYADYKSYLEQFSKPESAKDASRNQ